jgi:hypothetical protein
MEFKEFDWSLVRSSVKSAGGQQKYEKAITQMDLKSEINIQGRARRLTRFLLARPEKHITLVSHGAFLLRLTGDEYFGNCEVRTYTVTRGHWKLKKVYYTGCYTS